MTRPIICVDGIDGSGKSHLAARIVQEAVAHRIGVALLRVDDFRRRVDWDEPGIVESDAYYDRYHDLERLDRCVQAYLRGDDAVEVPYFDPSREQITETRQLALRGVEVLVIEGVFARRLPSAADATLVYVATSYPEARRRILARDTARGRTAVEVSRRIDRRYVPTQLRYHREHQPRERAHVVIDHETIGAAHAPHIALDGRPAVVVACLRFLGDGPSGAAISFAASAAAKESA